MSNRRKHLLVIVLGLLLVLGIGWPSLVRFAALRWAKHAAWKKIEPLPPEFRKNLNATPTLIRLPDPHDEPLETVEYGNFRITLRKPISHEISRKILRIVYPDFECMMFPVYAPTDLDALARVSDYKDAFDYQAAVYHARADDIDSQPNLDSLKRHLLLISQKLSKLSYSTYLVQFERPDLRGFIIDVDPAPNRIFAEVYFRDQNLVCGIHFLRPAPSSAASTQTTTTLPDLHPSILQFLSNLRIIPSPTSGPSP